MTLAPGTSPNSSGARIPLSSGLALILILLFTLPALSRLTAGSNVSAGAFAVLPFVSALYLIVILANRGSIALPLLRTTPVPLLMWSAILLVSLLRSNNDNHAGASGTLLVGMWTGILVCSALIAIEIHRRGSATLSATLWALSMAGGVLATINVLLQLAGVMSIERMLVDHPEGRLAALLGIRLDRTLLPMARGINNFGVIAGMGVAGSLGSLIGRHQSPLRRILAIPLLAGSLAALVYVDSRGPLIFGMLAGLGVPLLYRLRYSRSTRLIAIFAPALPLLLLAVLSLAARSEVVRQLSRQQGDIASATGRAIIWGASAGRLAAQPSPTDLFGYGQYGAKGAGISVVWAQRFKDFEADPLLTSTHNLTLQLIYDTGYLGLVAVLACVWWAIAYLGRLYDEYGASGALPAAAVLVFVLLAGTTEATISIIFPECLVFISLLIAISSVRPAMSPTQTPDS